MTSASTNQTWPEDGDYIPVDPPRSWRRAMGRGARRRCPACGEKSLFASYIRTSPTCARCGLEISGHQADDAPAYITMMIVGHLAIPLALAVKQVFDPPLSWQFAFWTPVMIVSALWLLPVAKGALVGLQWANRMHGFSTDHDDDLPVFADDWAHEG